MRIEKTKMETRIQKVKADILSSKKMHATTSSLLRVGHECGFSSQCQEGLPKVANGGLWAKCGPLICCLGLSSAICLFLSWMVANLKKLRHFILFESISGFSLKKKSEDTEGTAVLGPPSQMAASAGASAGADIAPL